MAYGFDDLDEPKDVTQAPAPGGGVGNTAPAAEELGQRQQGRADAQNATNTAANGAGTSYNDFLSGSGPTQTGYLNFDSFAAANGQASRDSADRLNQSTANAAKKAKQGVYDVNDSYQTALAGGTQPGPRPGSGGAAGPVYSAPPAIKQGQSTAPPAIKQGTPGSTSQALTGDSTKAPTAPNTAPPAVKQGTAPSAPTGTASQALWGDSTKPGAQPATPAAGPILPPPNTAPSAIKQTGTPSKDPYRDMLEQNAGTTYNGPTNLSSDPRYQQVGTDVRNAQRSLDATQDGAGLAAASGGTYADGALMNQQGQRAFQQTRDAYGNLNKFAGQVDANAAAQGDKAKSDAAAKAADYREQLGKYDQAASDKAKAVAANQPFSDEARKALPGYQQYTEGSKDKVTGLGTKSDFVNSLGSGANAPGEGSAFNGRAKQFADAATKSLGISADQLKAAMTKMTDQEYQDFWIAGVIPQWMDAPGAARGTGGASKGTAGGWPSPFADSAANYDPEGMGKAAWGTTVDMGKGVGQAALAVL